MAGNSGATVVSTLTAGVMVFPSTVIVSHTAEASLHNIAGPPAERSVMAVSLSPAAEQLQLAYPRLTIREAQRQCGMGWWTIIGYFGSKQPSTPHPGGIQCHLSVELYPGPPAESLVMAVSLSPAAEPFPMKLMEKIRSVRFVEMKADNVSLLQQLGTLNVQCALPTYPPMSHMREMGSSLMPGWQSVRPNVSVERGGWTIIGYFGSKQPSTPHSGEIQFTLGFRQQLCSLLEYDLLIGLLIYLHC
jgi:hypothetical protein